MRSKLGTWSTGGKSAWAGGAPIGKDKAPKVKKPLSSDSKKKTDISKTAKRASAKKPKAFGDDGAFKRTKRGI